MLFATSGLENCAVDGTDGGIGSVEDFLFDDRTWQIRWIVLDTGDWLAGRKVLIHPSAVAPLDIGPPSDAGRSMMTVAPDPRLAVRLSRQQVEQSPDIAADEPVSAQMELRVFDYYGWDPKWGQTYFGGNAIASSVAAPPLIGAAAARDEPESAPGTGSGDPHLRSAVEIIGYHTHASDGDIGHLELLLADDGGWDIRYLVVATRNWWPGKHVLLAPYAVQRIDWRERRIGLNITREQVQSSPPWDPAAMVDRAAEQELHKHYGWPGYGW